MTTVVAIRCAMRMCASERVAWIRRVRTIRTAEGVRLATTRVSARGAVGVATVDVAGEAGKKTRR